MSQELIIKKAAVLGAGVMGAQIAAYLVGVGIETYLYDLPGGEKDLNSIAHGAIKALKKLKPSPLTQASEAELIRPANYQTDLGLLKECDFVIEAISEKMAWKHELYQKIAPFLKPGAVVATNTSGLSIEELSSSFPEHLKPHFLGVHFFNPPRYMKLVEFIPHSGTDITLLAQLESFFVVRLGKGVIYAKDTPNFIANRIGVFSILSIIHHAEMYNISPDVVDLLTGPLIGRPKSATFRTLDIVGLDTMRHVVQTIQKDLKTDPWRSIFTLPEWIDDLIERGALGQKTKSGVYKKQQNDLLVFEPREGRYRPSVASVQPEVLSILKLPKTEQLESLKQSKSPQAQFLYAVMRDLFHYCAYCLESIASSTRDVDLAMRWGYAWTVGPFEWWQEAGFDQIKSYIDKDIQEGKGNLEPLPKWVDGLSKDAFFNQEGAFSPSLKIYIPRSNLPCYERQIYKDKLPLEPELQGRVIFENEGLMLWTLDNKTSIVSFKTKRNCISRSVLEGLIESIDRSEKDYTSMVIWQKSDGFSVGANLVEILQAMKSRKFEIIDQMIQGFHQVAMRLKYASIPVVAAIEGLCLGGGTEIVLHTHRRVAALETYMGLPEVSIGVIPAGGGCKELVITASQLAREPDDLASFEILYNQVAQAKVSTSAKEAFDFHYLRPKDTLVMQSREILYEAIKQAQILSGPAFYSPLQKPVAVFGKIGMAQCQAWLINMREGDFISDYDLTIGTQLAEVFSGGRVDEGTYVDEKWLLDLERHAFMKLIESPLALARIEHTLATGKPLRN